jgi:hypothetical protein
MSKRLQVVMDDAEFAEIQAHARLEGQTVSQWVRRALRQARDQTPDVRRRRKLAALRAARGHDFPTGDIERLLDETQRGYRS